MSTNITGTQMVNVQRGELHSEHLPVSFGRNWSTINPVQVFIHAHVPYVHTYLPNSV